MAIGLNALLELLPVKGIRWGTTAANIKKANRKDLVVLECLSGTQVAAVFTQNKFCAAPIIIARQHLVSGSVRACIINTGYANAGTGDQGKQDALASCMTVAQALGCQTNEVLPFSTGVIGEPLPIEKIIKAVPECVANLDASGWQQAAQGIMTTDTQAKGYSSNFKMNGDDITITGIVKGAGMIRPNMATLLAFVATDAKLDASVAQAALNEAVKYSFNRITVDGDTSTNDACVLFATGQSGRSIELPAGDDYIKFAAELKKVLTYLAQAVIRDAEGITKFITIAVKNGNSETDCLEAAYSIAHSPLVKTAFFASDPNWGRILAAVGRANIGSLNIETVSIKLDDVIIINHGEVAADYNEARGQAVMDKQGITIGVDLGMGTHSATVWTSDLSHDYVTINAEYRT